MEKNIYLYGVTFVNFADFYLAEFVENVTVDCRLAKDAGESSSQKKSSLLAQQCYSIERTATFPKHKLLL